MEVIIHKPTTTLETNVTITYKFYGGDESHDVCKAKGLDVGKKIEARKKSNAYKKAKSKKEEAGKRQKQRLFFGKDSKEEDSKRERHLYRPPHKRGGLPPGHWHYYSNSVTWAGGCGPYVSSPAESCMLWAQEEALASQPPGAEPAQVGYSWGSWYHQPSPFQIQPSIEGSFLELPPSGHAQSSQPPGLEPAQVGYPWGPWHHHPSPFQIQPSLAGSSSELPPSGHAQSSVMAQATDSIVAETANANILNHVEQQGTTAHLDFNLSEQQGATTEKMPEWLRCVVCLTEKQEEMILPCGHMCLCGVCVKEVVPRALCKCKGGCAKCLCPLCREPIEGVKHVYYGA